MTDTMPALAVLRPFGRYSKGDLITDADAIKAVLASGNGHAVVRTVVPTEPEPAPPSPTHAEEH